MRDSQDPGRPPRGALSVAFLLAQVGSHAAARFAERLAALDLSPPHAGILRALHAGSGLSQQALGKVLGILPSRLVILVDELEERGIVERRDSPDDRRSYALTLTKKGDETLEAIGKIARTHDEEICTALSTDERDLLATMLRRIAEQQGLTPGVHPGFRRLGRPSAIAGRRQGRRRRHDL
jgi:DNA-binding MarR family transcriptional regulator